jgi:serine protease Do
MATALGLDGPRGVLVVSVAAGSAASIAGIEVGDVILKLAGAEVTDLGSLQQAAGATRPGQPVDIVVWREGTVAPIRAVMGRPIEVAAADLPSKASEKGGQESPGLLGVRVKPVTPDAAAELNLDEAFGALVEAVTPDGAADNAGLVEGDVVLEFDGQEVRDHQTLRKLVADTRAGQQVTVVLWRDRSMMIAFVTMASSN